jgi:hypothetical protein
VPSRARAPTLCWRIAALLLSMACGHGVAQPAAGVSAGAAVGVAPVVPPLVSGTALAPTAADIRAAVDKLRADPNLGTKHSVRSLQWVKGDAPAPSPDTPAWILGLFQFLGQTASLFLWLAGAVVAAFAAVWIYRLIRARAPRAPVLRQAAASHIGGLDISPESLPDDIGAAALGLLQAGRTRDALSLLYRGALSCAVHRYGVVIDPSFTEAEALRAVEGRLDGARVNYFRELIGLWQRVVYAGQTATPEPVATLCTGFAATLESAA